eukprot:TRINITY_DN976_c0_g1_i3.p1 TRINITY_DN976_c0_g1~~TRINITY_DN976_c0_g1_i3.p1  ORF type:complete len:195 (-),score=66.39 TRINITY_DN976_c0_g1_i3:243-827(-)
MFGFGRQYDSLFPHSLFERDMQMIDDFIDRDLYSWPSTYATYGLPQLPSTTTQPADTTSTSSSSSATSGKQLAQPQETSSIRAWRPSLKSIRVDVLDQKDKITVRAEVPGLPKEQIKLHLDNNVLTITGKHSEEKKDEKPNYVRHECSYGEVSRSLRLPKNIDAKKVNAKYENGILTVEIPKTKETKPMDIVIG